MNKKPIKEIRVIKMVERNQGNTAMGLALMLRCRCGTLSSRLCKMARVGKIKRIEATGMTSDITKAWRYYSKDYVSRMGQL